MDNFNEDFFDKEEENEPVEGGLVDMEGSEESTGNHIEDEKVEKKEPWGYEILENGELGAVDGLVDPEAVETKQESPGSESKDEIVDVIMNGSQISLVGKNEEELELLFDTLEEISRNFFISQNTEIVAKSKQLKTLVEKYRINPNDFIKENPALDLGNLLDSE
jgi:hypothetical protein